MIHGLVNESANVFDMEALQLLSAYAERSAGSGPVDVAPVPAVVASAARAAVAASERPSVLRLAFVMAALLVFGALGPIVNAVRAHAAEVIPHGGIDLAR